MGLGMASFSKGYLVTFFSLAFASTSFAGIDIVVNAQGETTPISPYLFGRNIYSGYGGEILDNVDSTSTVEMSNMNLYNEAGIRFLRMNQGNNGTKHNWRKNISSHPDWFNNVYYHNWDISSRKILENMPNTDAMYGFQLAGYVAGSLEHNFDEIAYKETYGKTPVGSLDLAGGGSVDGNGNLISAGNSALYLEKWPADSTVGILDHWQNSLKYDMSRFQYWSMDNEMELWPTTHSDLPYTYTPNTLETPERIITNYVEVAKKAKALFPDIKLTGPVSANEWLWCNLYHKNDAGEIVHSVVTDGTIRYCWLEYFIMRIAEEEKKAGMKLLDVFDIHWYPTETTYEHWINWHRVFFDTTYNYPGANGIKRANEGCTWDESITKEYIFKRIGDWLEKYMGKDHGITFAFTETDFVNAMDPMTRAIVYASFMGTFMDNGVEIFTPWEWRDGMYEVVHLFSQYSQELRIPSLSSNDSLVSAYSSINNTADSLTIILVNRAETQAQTVNLKIDNFELDLNAYPTFTLSDITGETFVSRAQNGLKEGTVTVENNAIPLNLPAKSITTILLSQKKSNKISGMKMQINPFITIENGHWIIQNPSQESLSFEIFNCLGQKIYSKINTLNKTEFVDTKGLEKGYYIIRFKTKNLLEHQKVILK